MVNVVARDNMEDPFVEADHCMKLQCLIDETMGIDPSCPANEYVNGDDDLPVCVDLNDNDWEDNFLAQLGQPLTTEENEDEEANNHELDKEPMSMLHSFSGAMKSLDDVKLLNFSLNVGGAYKSLLPLGQQWTVLLLPTFAA